MTLEDRLLIVWVSGVLRLVDALSVLASLGHFDPALEQKAAERLLLDDKDLMP